MTVDRPVTVKGLHSTILTLDAHLDAPIHFSREGWSFGDRHEHSTEIAQLDLPRMADGNLTGGFFVIYTPQGELTSAGYADAFAHAERRSSEIDAMIAKHGLLIGSAKSVADVQRLRRERKLVCLKSMENSYAVGEDLCNVSRFASWGVRLAGPVHAATNQLADSATGSEQWSGLSPLGVRWVEAMNHAGIIVDGSHASDFAFDQMLELSRSPIILSHSGSRAIHNDPRNIDDARIRALARAEGVIAFATIFLSPILIGSERAELFAKLGRIGDLGPAEQSALTRRWRKLDEFEPMWAAGFDDYMRALMHVIEVAGVDHVAFGADFDGGGGIPGIEDITTLPRITERLQASGLAEADIEKMWSGNLLRLLGNAEALVEVRADFPAPGYDAADV